MQGFGNNLLFLKWSAVFLTYHTPMEYKQKKQSLINPKEAMQFM
jgi:hypothetical protein